MKNWAALTIAAFLILVPATVRTDPSVHPVGTTIYTPEKCWNGFTILSAEEGRLVDMNGNLVHLWKGPAPPPEQDLPRRVSSGVNRCLETGPPGRHRNSGQGFQRQSRLEIRPVAGRQGQRRRWDDVGFPPASRHADKKQSGRLFYAGLRSPRHFQRHPPGFGPLQCAERQNQQKRHGSWMMCSTKSTWPTGKIAWTWKAADHLDEMGFDDAALKAMQNLPRQTARRR